MNLELSGIYPRRYFYPSLSSLKYVKKSDTPVADAVSSSILCLPLYYDLSKVEQDMVASTLLKSQKLAFC